MTAAATRALAIIGTIDSATGRVQLARCCKTCRHWGAWSATGGDCQEYTDRAVAALHAAADPRLWPRRAPVTRASVDSCVRWTAGANRTTAIPPRAGVSPFVGG